MIEVFRQGGNRVIAPDFFGFGRSDKPTDDLVYGFDFHRNYLVQIIHALELENITLVCQDWGGVIGLTLPMEFPDLFKRMIVMNTTLAVGELPSQGFADWKAYCASRPDLDVVSLMQRSTSTLSAQEAQAYGAPFVDETYKAGVRRFPQMLMIEPQMEGTEISLRAREFLRTQWTGQCFMAVGAADPVLGMPVMTRLQKDIRGASPLMVIEEGGHFVQEWGTSIAHSAMNYFSKNRQP